jgi:hypothetical protein
MPSFLSQIRILKQQHPFFGFLPSFESANMVVIPGWKPEKTKHPAKNAVTAPEPKNYKVTPHSPSFVSFTGL